jgi:hypothetical protein
MINFLRYIFILVLLQLLNSCQAPIKTKASLQNYINSPENGLNIIKDVQGIQVSCAYFPKILFKEKQSENLNNNLVYFILSFSKDDKELLKQLDYSTYSEMVQVFSFRMMNYISLLPAGSKPIEPIDCLFQQTYGYANANCLLLVFDKKSFKKSENITIRLNEFGLGLGDQLFEFETEQLSHIDETSLTLHEN